MPSKHTPGPWEYDWGDVGQDYSHRYCTVSKDGGDLIIAEVNDLFDRQEGHANTRLIAAAPDTYECAKDGDEIEDIWLREWQRALGPDAVLSDEAQTRLHQLRQKRYAAIAKATGESDA